MRVLDEREIILTPALMASRTYREPVHQPRSKGVHVQSVNRALAIAAGKLDDTGDGGSTFVTTYPLLPAMGVAWEEFRASLYSDLELLWQPFELHRDGIYGTPDGLIARETGYDIWECKLTTKKYNHNQKFGALGDCWLYMKQGMSYCAMYGALRVRYDVNWMLGNYMRPYKPVLTSTLIEFNEMEVEQWWQRILAAAPNVQPEV